MNQEIKSYLCGGTFFTQILRTKTNRYFDGNNHPRSTTQQAEFKALISIFHLSDFEAAGQTIKTNASTFKTCHKSLHEYCRFQDPDILRNFNEDGSHNNSKALTLMEKFVTDFIKDNLYDQLIKCLLGIIQNDSEIKDDDEFFILGNGTTVKKKELCKSNHFIIEPFLLGIWHYIIMNRSDKNEKGQDTYLSWFDGKKYIGTVGSVITQEVKVERYKSGKEDDDNLPLEIISIDQANVVKQEEKEDESENNSSEDERLFNEFKRDIKQVFRHCKNIEINCDISKSYTPLYAEILYVWKFKWEEKTSKINNEETRDRIKSVESDIITFIQLINPKKKSNSDYFKRIKQSQAELKKLYNTLYKDADFV